MILHAFQVSEIRFHVNAYCRFDFETLLSLQLELLTIIEMFWHLCEIILVDMAPG